MSPAEVRPSEIIPLYRLLKTMEEELDGAMIGLMDRLARRLFASLSIEEVESIPALDETALDELSKKL